MIFQGLAPNVWGALADVRGRRITFICTFLVFFAACITLANTRDYGTLVGVRCLQSAGSASSITLGAGVIGDITTRSERGGYMGIFQAGLLVPVAVGPIIGGGLDESLGWRSVFWFLAIYNDQLPGTAHFRSKVSAFIANGVGSMVGSLTTGKLLDKDYTAMNTKYEEKEDEMPLDHVRLRLMWIWSTVQICSVLLFAWMLEKHIHMAVPIMCTFFTGWAAMAIQSTVSTYMVDLIPNGSASASAEVNSARCLLGAGGSAAAMPILDSIGIGWGFTMALGLIIVQLRLGRKWRSQYQENEIQHAEG